MKTVFISYFKSEVNTEKLSQLIKLLQKNNIRVVIDDRDLEVGDDLPLFMEKSLTESDFVIVILGPGYKKNADKRLGGVGYETGIMAATLSKQETTKKFIPVTFETYRDDIVPVFLASKFACDLSDGLDTLVFQQSFERLKRVILDVPAISQQNQKSTTEKVVKTTDATDILLTDADDKNAQIMIVKIDSDEVTQPRNDGKRGSALYSITFQLNHSPNQTWKQLFLENWHFPSKLTLMHRPNIAKVNGNRIILDGTTIEEVKDYHLKTLKLVIQDTNKQYKHLIIKKLQAQEKATEIETKWRNKVKSIVKDFEL